MLSVAQRFENKNILSFPAFGEQLGKSRYRQQEGKNLPLINLSSNYFDIFGGDCSDIIWSKKDNESSLAEGKSDVTTVKRGGRTVDSLTMIFGINKCKLRE